jgi:hypothetical protein
MKYKSRRLIPALFALLALLVPTTASAYTTTRYEAENYTPAAGVSYTVISNSSVSGGSLLRLNSSGYVEIPVTTDVYSATAHVKSESCSGDAQGHMKAIPSYFWQEDTVTSAQVSITSDGYTGLLVGPYTETGIPDSAPTFNHTDPNKIRVYFDNDYVGGGCDRNLRVDYVEVLSS